MTKAELIQYIRSNIYPNGQNQITAPMVRDAVIAVVDFLGDAAAKDIGAVLENNTGLVTGGSVYDAIRAYVSEIFRLVGETTTDVEDDPFANPVMVDGVPHYAQKGDVVLFGSKEFWWNGTEWKELGDEASWALKTITITGTGDIEGGGSLEANRTLDLTQAAKDKLAHGETAFSWLESYMDNRLRLKTPYDYLNVRKGLIFEAETDYSNTPADLFLQNVTIEGEPTPLLRTKRPIVSDSFISAGGLSYGGGSGGIDLNAMWGSLTNSIPDVYANTPINIAHIPNISVSKVLDIESWISGKGYATTAALAGYLPTTGGTFTGRLRGPIFNTSPDGGQGLYRGSIFTSALTTSDVVLSALGNKLWIYAENIRFIINDNIYRGGEGSTVYTIYDSGNFIAGTNYVSPSALANYQPLDADLTAIAGLSGTSGFLKKTAANTWSLDTNTYATTSALAGYLPTTGGTFTGRLRGPRFITSPDGDQGIYRGSIITGALTSSDIAISVGGNKIWMFSANIRFVTNDNIYRDNGSTIYTIYDSGNSNLTTVPWSASSLTLNGAISGATSIDSLLYFDATNSRVGVLTGSPAYTFDVSGVMHATTGIFCDGYVSAGGFSLTSDIRLKTEIKPITAAKAWKVLLALNPTEFRWIRNGERSAGFVAQEVEPIVPFAVREVEGVKRLNYENLFTYGMAALRDMKGWRETTEQRIERLETMIREAQIEIERLRA